MNLFHNRYRVESARLQNWDYSWNGMYFITICTYNRESYFGNVKNREMQLNETGVLANKYWAEIPKHFPFVQLDEFVVMPNHIHGIIVINKPDGGFKEGVIDNVDDDDDGNDGETRHALSLSSQPPHHNHAPRLPNIGRNRYQNQGKGSISAMVGSYKSVVSRMVRNIDPDFKWQSRFYDHLVRDSKSLMRIQNYIINNPKNWQEDRFHG